ncbi:MAG TPA: sigma-70 family RNA polymerase sigma factor [Planctomycetota bacterium]
MQGYLDAIARDPNPETEVRELLEQAVNRLHLLCGNLLRRSYPRLMRPPLNLQPEEMLSGVVERLLKALRTARPENVRGFFALANRHMRWELNDLARKLDHQPRAEPIVESAVAAAMSSTSEPSPNTRRMLQAIDELLPDEREVFCLVRLHGLSHADAAAVLDVSCKTVQRRLHRGMLLLVEALNDLQPPVA